jgi:hypothetical protein
LQGFYFGDFLFNLRAVSAEGARNLDRRPRTARAAEHVKLIQEQHNSYSLGYKLLSLIMLAFLNQDFSSY